jgi:hypothetical protein
VLAEINYPATQPSYNSNNTGKYVDFLHITNIMMGLEPEYSGNSYYYYGNMNSEKGNVAG